MLIKKEGKKKKCHASVSMKENCNKQKPQKISSGLPHLYQKKTSFCAQSFRDFEVFQNMLKFSYSGIYRLVFAPCDNDCVYIVLVVDYYFSPS